MKWVLLCALCACNQVLGLSTPIPIDGQQFDAPLDAPFACPEPGVSPVFSPRLHQQIQQYCFGYMTSPAGRAIASCDGVISEGPIDSKLSPLPGLPVNDLRYSVDVPRLNPDGESMQVGVFDLDLIRNEFRIYQRDAAGTWSFASTLPFGDLGGIVSSMTLASPRHILYRPSLDADLLEYAESASTWVPVATHTLASLGASSLGNVWLSADGLRMVIQVDTQTQDGHLAWTDRPSIDAPFRMPTALVAPRVADAFINADCSRLYFTGLHSVFYAQRL